MSLPKFQSDDRIFNQLQTQWSSQIDPVLNNPANQSQIISNVVLSSSSVINHGLGRKLQGWAIVRKRGNANIFDYQDTNARPEKTLLLNSSSGISVDVLVF